MLPLSYLVIFQQLLPIEFAISSIFYLLRESHNANCWKLTLHYLGAEYALMLINFTSISKYKHLAREDISRLTLCLLPTLCLHMNTIKFPQEYKPQPSFIKEFQRHIF